MSTVNAPTSFGRFVRTIKKAIQPPQAQLQPAVIRQGNAQVIRPNTTTPYLRRSFAPNRN